MRDVKPRLGIWARMPMEFGWLRVLQTLTVAHRSVERLAFLIAAETWACVGGRVGWTAPADALAASTATITVAVVHALTSWKVATL